MRFGTTICTAMGLTAASLCAVVLSAGTSEATTLSVVLNKEFSGATPSEGNLIASITDEGVGANQVKLTLDTSLMTLGQKISDFYFNIGANGIAETDPGGYQLLTPSGAVCSVCEGTFSFGPNAFKADGVGGDFDAKISWPVSGTPASPSFDAGDSFSVILTGDSSFGIDTFKNKSFDPGNAAGGLFVAAHVQSIGPNNNDSGWMTGKTGFTPTGGGLPPVPLPATLPMLLTGLLGGGFVLRRKARKT